MIKPKVIPKDKFDFMVKGFTKWKRKELIVRLVHALYTIESLNAENDEYRKNEALFDVSKFLISNQFFLIDKLWKLFKK